MKSPEQSQETQKTTVVVDEIWATVHDDPSYSVYGYPKALQLVIYDAQRSYETGGATLQEVDVVIAAAEALITKYAKSRVAAQRSLSPRRVPF